MKRALILAGIFCGSSALGLLLAALILSDRGFHLALAGFLVTVAVFMVAQGFFDWLLTRIWKKSASPLLGGVGLISTALALVVASLIPGGVTVADPVAWVLASLVVWLVSALGIWLLPIWLLKKPKPRK
jgi:hypothetical protein